MNARATLINAVAIASLCGFLAGCAGDSPEALLASAKDYLAKNDPKAAVIQLKNALVKNPDIAEARFLLGKTLLEAGEVPSAEKELRRARDLKYPAGQVDPPLALAWVKLGEYKRVVDEFSQAQGATPHDTAELRTAVGQAQYAMHKPDLAKAAFADAQRADPGYTPALVGEARMKAEDGDFTGALALADKALTANPNATDALQFKGDVLLAQKHIGEAVDLYRKAIALSPQELSTHGALITALLRDGKPADANKALEAMQAVAPKQPQTYYYEALVRSQEKDFKAAREAVQKQLALAPDNPPGSLLAASIDYELHDYDRAEAGLHKLLAQLPQNDFARRLLVGTYVRSRQPAKALDALKPMLARIDGDAMMQNLAGEVYLQNGEPEIAAGYFEKATALDPSGARAKAGLALTRFAQGDSAGGIKDLEAAATIDTGTRSDLMLIAVAIRQQRWDQALAAIDALEKKEPAKPLVANLRGLTLLGKRDVAGARKSFEHALSLDPDYFPATANLARIDLAEKKPKVAEKRFEDLLSRNPKSSQAMLALAQLRAHDGASPDEVAKLIDRAVVASPNEIAPRLALMRHYMGAKDPRKAVTAGRDALNAIPGRPELLDALGQAQQAAGDTSEALSTYGRYAEVAPDSPLPYMRIGALQASAKNYDAAIQSFKRALTIKSDLVEAQKGLALLYLRADRLPDALSVAKDMQKQRPKEAVGYVVEGDIHASKRDWTKAVAAYRIGMDAGNAEAAVKAHAGLVASGQNADAQKMAAAWLREHPSDDTFKFSLAELAGQHKDYAVAMKYYAQVLENQPNNPVLLNNFAWVAGQAKDPRALEYAERANKIAPNQANIMDTLGTLLVEKGDKERGVAMLRKAVDLAPQLPTIRLNLARALVKTGQNDAARKELDTLADLGGKFDDQDEVTRLRKGL